MTTEEKEDEHGFDSQLERELERRKYDRTNTTTAKILGTKEWSKKDNITLELSVPVDADSPVTTTLEMPSDTPLSESKIGHILAAHNYEPEQAKHLLGETVDVYYDSDDWQIADPIDTGDGENRASTDTKSVEPQLDQQEENAEGNGIINEYNRLPSKILAICLAPLIIGISIGLTVGMGAEVFEFSTIFGYSVEGVLSVVGWVSIMPAALLALATILYMLLSFIRILQE